MKRFLFLSFVALFALQTTLDAHTVASYKKEIVNPNLLDICNALTKSKVFVQYRKFGDDFQKMNAEVAPKLSYAEHERLHLAYNNVERKYNDFLTLVKSDVSDFKTIKAMGRNPEKFIEGYADEYQTVINAYQREYMPVYNDVKNKTRGFNPVLLNISVDLVTNIIDWIKQRQELREEQLNTILGIVNKYFYDELRMKSWTELGLKPAPDAPIGSTAASSAAEVSSSASGRRKNTDTDAPKPIPTDVLNPVEVPAPTFKELFGFVEFVFLKDDVTPTPMSFTLGATRDIGIGYLKELPKNTKTDVPIGTATVKTMVYNSAVTFGENTHFQLKVNNTAGMYIIALNKQGKDAEFLYPYDNKDLPACSVASRTGMRDIGITTLPVSPVVGKDIDGNITLPTADCSTTPPTQRYYTISGNNQPDETFCVLLSKSELDMKDIEQRVEAESGPLGERLSRIFGTKAINPNEANLSVANNKLSFDARTAQNNVLPLVFMIKRK